MTDLAPVGNTPLVRLRRMRDAEARGLLADGTRTILDSTSGNTGIALAQIGEARGQNMSPPTLIRLSEALEQQLRRHGEEQYPNEACGALLGAGDGTTSAWRVTEIRAAPNEHADDLRRRYLVPPAFQLQLEKHARATGQDVIGYYHSHPDHPAHPSEYDRAHAWCGYLYLICAVQQGRATDLNAFALEDQNGAVLDVHVQDGPAPAR
jgi:proteasome lid subunit RPN8/RPN11